MQRTRSLTLIVAVLVVVIASFAFASVALASRAAPFDDGARVVLVKGDRNDRQLTGDTIWGESTWFSGVVRYFPAPLVTLRTLKSDGLVGVDARRVRALDAQGGDWRVSGQYGVIQAAGFPAL